MKKKAMDFYGNDFAFMYPCTKVPKPKQPFSDSKAALNEQAVNFSKTYDEHDNVISDFVASLSQKPLQGRQALCYSDTETFQFSSHKRLVKDLNPQYLHFLKVSYEQKEFVDVRQVLFIMNNIISQRLNLDKSDQKRMYIRNWDTSSSNYSTLRPLTVYILDQSSKQSLDQTF